MKLGIVTATTNAQRVAAAVQNWRLCADNDRFLFYVVFNGLRGPYNTAEIVSSVGCTDGTIELGFLGSVPAFRRGVDLALTGEADVIACLHDDFVIMETGWDTKVLRHFERYPACGLAGFGGAIGLGDSDLYQKPYAPMQLARQSFRSNLVDAEAHGLRSLLPERVACLDGFSQIGRRDFWYGEHREARPGGVAKGDQRPWAVLEDMGIMHHFYDGALGCLAARYGWEVWYLPLRGQHLGGQTAVGDPAYQEWAKTQIEEGDHGFWKRAHQVSYEAFRDILPIRV